MQHLNGMAVQPKNSAGSARLAVICAAPLGCAEQMTEESKEGKLTQRPVARHPDTVALGTKRVEHGFP